MDPLTHTLVGANLAATRLGTKSRLAAAACLIGANAPDIDVTAYFRGEDFAIGFRRGWTHGVAALVVLPIALWLILLIWDRVASRRSRSEASRTPLHRGWLLFLCVTAVLTHPFLDWLNVYGMRWLMPFDGTWFYGDSVFIMDPWLWLILGSLWLIPRRPTRALVISWGVLSALLALVVAGRAPAYLPVIAAIAGLLLLALLWKPGSDRRRRLSGALGLALAGAYIGGMIVLHDATVSRVRATAELSSIQVDALLVGPLPLDSLGWDVLIQTSDHYRFGTWSWRNRELELTETRLPLPYDSELWKAASADPAIAGFIDWVRYPWLDTERVDGGTRVYVLDARYTRSRQEGFGSASVIVPD